MVAGGQGGDHCRVCVPAWTQVKSHSDLGPKYRLRQVPADHRPAPCAHVLLSCLPGPAQRPPSSRQPSQTTSLRLLSCPRPLSPMVASRQVPEPGVGAPHTSSPRGSRQARSCWSGLAGGRGPVAASLVPATQLGGRSPWAAAAVTTVCTYHPEEGPGGQSDILLDGGQHTEDEADQDDEEAVRQETRGQPWGRLLPMHRARPHGGRGARPAHRPPGSKSQRGAT